MDRGEKPNFNLLNVHYGTTKQGKKTHSNKFSMAKTRLVRPRFKNHICEREDNCKICIDYINRLQEWRNKK